MIDNPVQVERLLPKLKEALPTSAGPTPRLAALLRDQSPPIELPQSCQVTSVDYAGDEGGIMCRLDPCSEGGSGAYFISITHLAFDRRQPLAREIAAYQKHRIKRLMRLAEPIGLAVGDH